MNRDEIISVMVKSRESCRQIVRLYESARENEDIAGGTPMARRNSLTRANSILSQMLLQMKRLPAKPADSVSIEEDRQYIQSLFSEISELIEKAMILEREVRCCVPPPEPEPERQPGVRCMKAYYNLG